MRNATNEKLQFLRPANHSSQSENEKVKSETEQETSILADARS